MQAMADPAEVLARPPVGETLEPLAAGERLARPATELVAGHRAPKPATQPVAQERAARPAAELVAGHRAAKPAAQPAAQERAARPAAELVAEHRAAKPAPQPAAQERAARPATELVAEHRAAQAGAPTGGASATGGAGTGGQGGVSAPPSTLVNTYDGERATTASFDSGWKFHLGDVTDAQATTFDDSSWTALDVPHDWSISLAFNQSSPAGSGGGYLDGGTGWYRKTFTLPASSGQKVFVQFDGVYMNSTVYLNGTQIGARPYGFSSFECDFGSNAKFGASNVLAVKVVNQQPSSRWYSGSGIYRHTWLKTVNPVRVAYTGTQVTTPTASTSSATVNISVTVQNDATTDQSVTLASSVRDSTGTEVGKATSAATTVTAGKTANVAQTVTVSNPKLWSVASPNLYSVVTTVSVGGSVVDTYTTPFGIRTFAFNANTGSR